MTKSFNRLREKMSPKAREQSRTRAVTLLRDMRLNELRKMRLKTQEDIARDLDVEQPYVSRLERQSDMYISRLRSYLEVIGGKLEIIARFPDVDVRITQFGEMKGDGE